MRYWTKPQGCGGILPNLFLPTWFCRLKKEIYPFKRERERVFLYYPRAHVFHTYKFLSCAS